MSGYDSREVSAPRPNPYSRRAILYKGSKPVGIVTSGGSINWENNNKRGNGACDYSSYPYPGGNNSSGSDSGNSNGNDKHSGNGTIRYKEKATQRPYDEILATKYINGLRFTGTEEEETYLQQQLNVLPFNDPRTDSFFGIVAEYLKNQYQTYGAQYPDYAYLIAQRLEILCERPDGKHSDYRPGRSPINPISSEAATKLLTQAGKIYHEIGRSDMANSIMVRLLKAGAFVQESSYLNTLQTFLGNGTVLSGGLVKHLIGIGYEEIAALQRNGNNNSRPNVQGIEESQTDPEFNIIFNKRTRKSPNQLGIGQNGNKPSAQLGTEVTKYCYLEAKSHKKDGRTEESLKTYEENLRILVGLYDHHNKGMENVVSYVFSETRMINNLPPELAEDIFDWTVELVRQIYESRNSISEEQRHRHIRKAILSYIVGKAKCCDYRAQFYSDNRAILDTKLAVLKQAADVAAVFNPNYERSAEMVSGSLSFSEGYWEVEGFADLIGDYYQDTLGVIAGEDERFCYTRQTTRKVRGITMEHYEERGDLMWSSGRDLEAMHEYGNREILKGKSDRSLHDGLEGSISLLRDKSVPREPKDVVRFCNSVLERAQAVYKPESIEFIQVQTIVINNLMDWVGLIKEQSIPDAVDIEKKMVKPEWYKALKDLFLKVFAHVIDNFGQVDRDASRVVAPVSEEFESKEMNNPANPDQNTPEVTLDTLYEELDILGKSLNGNIDLYLGKKPGSSGQASVRSGKLITDSRRVLSLAAEEVRKRQIYCGNDERAREAFMTIAESNIDLFEEIVTREANPNSILDGFDEQDQRLYKLFINLTRLLENNKLDFRSHRRLNEEFNVLARRVGYILPSNDSILSLNSEILTKCQEMLHTIALNLPPTQGLRDMPTKPVLDRPLSVGFAASN